MMSSAIYSQSSYIHFPDSGTYWKGGGSAYDISVYAKWDYLYFLGGDTILDTLEYNKLFRHSHPKKPHFIGGIREDTIQGKVFFFNVDDPARDTNQEYLLYDFSLRKGDSINTYIWGSNQEIDFIDTMIINGKIHRTWHIFQGEYVEGIGFLADLLDPYCGLGYCNGLECMVVHDSLYYSYYPSDSCDLSVRVSVSEIEKENELLHIWPNPMSTELSIESQVFIEAVEIYNLEGQLIYTQKVNRIKQVQIKPGIDKSGLYFLRVFSGKSWNSYKLLRE